MAYLEDVLKMPAEAARHRQLLGSTFPQSPAASSSVASSDASDQPVARPAGRGSFDEVPATAPIIEEAN
jgi:hypothetical protein